MNPEVRKVWGTDQRLFDHNCAECHLLRLQPHKVCPTDKPRNVRCSRHVHLVKWNKFVVLEGELTVAVWVEDEPPKECLVTEGQEFVVMPGLYHYFKVTKPAKVLEFVWADSIGPDIDRLDEGRPL